MVAGFNKEFLSWYLITVKLGETIKAGIATTFPTANNRSIQFPQQEEAHRQEHQPSEPPQIVIRNSGDQRFEDGPKPSKPEWLITIKDQLEQGRQDDAASTWEKICIYRVPHYLRGRDDKAIVPQIVSLGPYHRGKSHLLQMERHKWRSLHHMLKRTNQDIKLFLDSIKEVEEKARACYEGLVEMEISSNEFVEMMVLDGCFVLELFRSAHEGFKNLRYLHSDPIFAMRGSMRAIQRDMIMLENQLPLFVLDRLLGLQSGNPEQKGLVAKLALRYLAPLDPLMPTYEPLTKSDRCKLQCSGQGTFDPLCIYEQGGLNCLDAYWRSLFRKGMQRTPRVSIKKRSQGGLHCLDVFRRSLLPKGMPGVSTKKRSQGCLHCLDVFRRSPLPEEVSIKKSYQDSRVADKWRQQLIHCVTELRDAGVKFKKGKTDRFTDVKFENGILRIPRLLIHDGTKSLFLNLIAFEQCHLDCSNDVTSYVLFMDNLINSPQDVGYLHYCGIIEHWLGSDAEVADLFNSLCQEVDFDISYLSRLSEEVNRYCHHKWNAWRASLKHKYFSNPWAILSLIAAVVLLLLTFTQTLYGVYAYYRPPN